MQSFGSSSFSEIEYFLFLFSITIRRKHDNKLGSSKCLYVFETLYFINKTFESKNIRIKVHSNSNHQLKACAHFFHFFENVKMFREKKLKMIIIQC